MKVKALAVRILTQLRHDKRTLAMMFGAPLLILTLIYFVLGDYVEKPVVAVVNAPLSFVEKLESEGLAIWRSDPSQAYAALRSGDVSAMLEWENGSPQLTLDGTDVAAAQTVLQSAAQALAPQAAAASPLDVQYIYGYAGLSIFDQFGAVLIGFIVFFLVFVVAGISFLQERTSGTLEKLLSTPIRRWEIVAGYTLGFGILTVVQSILIAWFAVYVLKVMMVGHFIWVMLITLLTAVTALTLGILLSTAAHNEFQMIQFIPIVIIPQIFFAGLFDLAPALAAFGRVMPLYYVADALTQVMLKGAPLTAIIGDMLALAGFSLLFMILNAALLKKYRRI